MSIPILIITIVVGVLAIGAAVAAVVAVKDTGRSSGRTRRRIRGGRGSASVTTVTRTSSDGATTVTRTSPDGRTTVTRTRTDLPEGSLAGLAHEVGAEYLAHLGSRNMFAQWQEQAAPGGFAGFGGYRDQLARAAAAHHVWLPHALDWIGHTGDRVIEDYMRAGTAYGTVSAYTFRRDREPLESAAFIDDSYAFVFDMCRFGAQGTQDGQGVQAMPIPQWDADKAELDRAADATGEGDIDRSDFLDDFGNAHHLIVIKARLSYPVCITLYRAFARCVGRLDWVP